MLQRLIFDKPVTGKINTILGNVGNGKNVLSVAIARWMSRRCKHGIHLEQPCTLCEKWKVQKRKVKVCANFPINLPEVECEYWRTPDDFFAARLLSQHQLWIIDEPDAWGFDSRSKGEINNRIGRKVKQCRHYDADTILIDQLNSMIDKRGRLLSGDIYLAIPPDNQNFRYGLLKPDYIIPFTISIKYAEKNIFPYYRTETIIGEDSEYLTDSDSEIISA